MEGRERTDRRTDGRTDGRAHRFLALEKLAAGVDVGLELAEEADVRVVVGDLVGDRHALVVEGWQDNAELARLRSIPHVLADGRLVEQHPAKLLLLLLVVVHHVVDLVVRALELANVLSIHWKK